ncbi:CvfB family protein [Fenollaria sporofastidiosus]|uniref:CvfB family protein n=1 Tax=Fenollaria sporofastidiosus TaxID=2811778 RepID=UPI001BFFF353|nr:S1-like domain-containing RNA-binding protein [Fenollaria sporofastidiosus]
MNKLGITIEAKVIKHSGSDYILEDLDKNTYHARSDDKKYDVGDTVKIFNYPLDGKVISSFRLPYIEVGEIKNLKVVSKTRIGYFLNMGLDKDVLLPFSEAIRDPKVGAMVLVKLYIDKSGRLATTMKIRNTLERSTNFKKGDIVDGIIYNISREFGLFVAIEDKYEAMVQKKDVCDDYELGERMKFRVQTVHEDGRLVLSTKLEKSAYDEHKSDSLKVYEILLKNKGKMNYADKSDPDDIRKIFNMSKSSFKRAIAILYRQRKIIINDDSIEIKED